MGYCQILVPGVKLLKRLCASKVSESVREQTPPVTECQGLHIDTSARQETKRQVNDLTAQNRWMKDKSTQTLGKMQAECSENVHGSSTCLR